MAATALGNIPLSTTIYPSADVDAAISGLASGVSEEIASAVSKAWKAGGSKAPSDLTSSLLVAANEGKVYNMSASGTTDSNFMEGAGKPYAAGTDIAVINTGTASSPVYKFNVLAVQDDTVVKSVNGITPTNGNVTIPGATYSGDGLMTSGDKSKLDNIASGAEANQNAFSVVAVSGQPNVEASGKTDTLKLAAGDNISMSVENGTVTIAAQVPSGVVKSVTAGGTTLTPDSNGDVDLAHHVVASISTDSGSVTPVSGTSGVLDIHGTSGISVVASGNSVMVDGGEISGAVSDLKNFSKITVKNASGTTVTNGTITPASNADADLGFKAGSNVTLSTSGKNVVISATVPVTDGKISGGSSLLSGTTIVIPTADSSGAYGVTVLAQSLENDANKAIASSVVSGAISGVNSGLDTKVSGGTLHTNLVSNGHSNPSTTPTSGTIYSLIKALHASDNTSES